MAPSQIFIVFFSKRLNFSIPTKIIHHLSLDKLNDEGEISVLEHTLQSSIFFILMKYIVNMFFVGCSPLCLKFMSRNGAKPYRIHLSIILSSLLRRFIKILTCMIINVCMKRSISLGWNKMNYWEILRIYFFLFYEFSKRDVDYDFLDEKFWWLVYHFVDSAGNLSTKKVSRVWNPN